MFRHVAMIGLPLAIYYKRGSVARFEVIETEYDPRSCPLLIRERVRFGVGVSCVEEVRVERWSVSSCVVSVGGEE